MSRFDECLKFVLQWEGGFTKDEADPGGATKFGVADAADGKVDGLADVDGDGNGDVAVAQLTLEEAKEIYRRKYWQRIRGDSLPKRMDIVVFDAAVNVGVVQASKFLQRALGVDDDGLIGPRTVDAAIHDQMCGLTDHVVADMLDQRREFYANLVAKKPTLRKFLNGWLNRVNALEKEVSCQQS